MDKRLNKYNKTTNYALVIFFGVIAAVLLYKTKHPTPRGGIRETVYETPFPEENIHIPVTDQASEANVSAKELANEFFENELAANRSWKDRIVTIKGTVDYVRTDIAGTPYIKLREGIQCMFPKHTEEQLIPVYPGQTVRVKGKISGLALLNVLVIGCTLNLETGQTYSSGYSDGYSEQEQVSFFSPSTPLPKPTALPREEILSESGTKVFRFGSQESYKQTPIPTPDRKSGTKVIWMGPHGQ